MEPAKNCTIEKDFYKINPNPLDDFSVTFFEAFENSCNHNDLYQLLIKQMQDQINYYVEIQTTAIKAGMIGFSEWTAQPHKILCKNLCELHYTYAVFTMKSFIEGGENFFCKQEFNEHRNSMKKVHKKAVEIIVNTVNSKLFLCGYLFDSNSNLSEIPKEIIFIILSPNLKLLNFEEFKKVNSNCIKDTCEINPSIV